MSSEKETETVRFQTTHMDAANAPDSLGGAPKEAQEETPAGHRAARSLSLRFRLGRKIGEGGMGTVYEAYDQNLDRSVAVKVFKTELSKDPLHLDRFFHEAEILASMDHPGVLPIYETGTLPGNGGSFYAMKFVHGKTLLDMINGYAVVDRKHPDRLHRFMRMFAEICDTMAYAHSHNIIHRDLKPENIMVDEYGVVLVLDWGLAKKIDSGYHLTRPGGIVGTPGYMSPEQVDAGSAPLDARSDVFALGIILYQILTGRLPFYAAHVLDVFEKICSEEPKSPREINKDVPKELEAICMKALRKDMGERYTSAKELSQDINRFLDGEEVSVYQRSNGERLKLWAGRHPALASGAMVAVVLLLMVGSVASALMYMRSATQARIILGVDNSIRALEEKAVEFDAVVPELQTKLETLPADATDARNALREEIAVNEMLEYWFRDFMRVPLAIQVGFLGADKENPYGSFSKETLELYTDSRIEQIEFLHGQGNLMLAHYQVHLMLFGNNNIEKTPEQKNKLIELQRLVESDIRAQYGENITMPDWSEYDLVDAVLRNLGKKEE